MYIYNVAKIKIKGNNMKLLYTMYCRIFQGVLKIGNYFMGYRMPECLEGAGKVKELGFFMYEKNINDVLVVTGESMFKRGQLQSMLDGFDKYNIRYTLQTYTTTDPTSEDVEKGFHTYRKHNCKAIVAIGGGSRIDCAKAIAAKVVHPNKSISQLQGLLKVHKKIPPFIAIPTTAGAGSETTVAAVITDSKTQRKASVNDPFLIPKYAVLDPELTATLPPRTTAMTGMDALSHAVEAYVNKTYNTPLEDKLAKEAVRLIYENMLLAYEDGSNLLARIHMQKAAFYAGRAFTRGCVGYVHAIGHTLGGLYHVPHGHAMAILLPCVMRQYGSAAHARLSQLADVCNIQGKDEEEKANRFLSWIEETNEKMQLETSFEIQKEAIPQMIAWAKKEANPLYPVPVIWDDDAFLKCILKVCK